MKMRWCVGVRGGLLIAALALGAGCADCGGDAASVDGQDMSSGVDMITGVEVERVCDDRLDEDGDGLIDCADPDCEAKQCAPDALCMTGECVGGESTCDDLVDDDFDGLIDCDDSDCVDSCACRDCAEECGNDRDDDGDGVIDEGCPCDFDGSSMGVCMSATRDSKQVCQPGRGYQVSETLCDGLDNDCDGAVDEGCPCLYASGTAGVCRYAVFGIDGQCEAPFRYQMNETACDGFDNDCDGATDEGCTLCDYQGVMQGVCIFGQVGADATECFPPEAYESTEAHCVIDPTRADGVDNDCDGVVDEGCRCPYQGSSTGVCERGSIDPGSGLCVAPLGYETQEVTCDGRDNDCDGQVDEDCERCDFDGSIRGVCRFGQPAGDGSCQPPIGYAPDERECVANPAAGDGRDNDCDGVVDEGCVCPYLGKRAGVCADGIIEPLEGRCLEPAGYEDMERSCEDGIDNDCDGRADALDPDCRLPEQLCGDNIDNDNDGDTDCADSDCAGSARCMTPADMGQDMSMMSDMGDLLDMGSDMDMGDGPDLPTLPDMGDDPDLPDVFDMGDEPDLPGLPDLGSGGEGSTCGSCYDGLDNDNDGFTDCDDQDCYSNPSYCFGPGSQGYGCNGEVCDDGMDNDQDNYVDCADYECQGHPFCTGNFDMGNGLDMGGRDMGGGRPDFGVPDLGSPDMGISDGDMNVSLPDLGL